MVEVGVRELKSRLSHYLSLMEKGEVVGIRLHRRLIGFLSRLRPPEEKRGRRPRWTTRALEKKIEEWVRTGVLVSGGLCRMRPIKPVPLRGDKSSTDLLRELRDEEP